ncbi:BTAD domain-containing putative transcriptional regulator [Plantactinospora sp. WMMB334]|uniref:BTAD domain-containing putative transcriptional regulator n=1 Tax=Plantactinospora sp. WMMB334 TaxID=3404119 RepID=UPI003B9665EA
MLATHRLGRAAVRAGSGIVTLAVVAGIPAGLVRIIGWPFPHDLPTSWDEIAALLVGGFPDTAVVGLLTVAVWLVWAAFCHALVVELAAARRGHPARRIRLISPMQSLAALLVAGLAAGPATAATVAVTAPTPAATPYTAGPTAPPPGRAATPVVAWPSHLPGTAASDATPRTVPATPTTTASPAIPDGVTSLPRFALAAHAGPVHLTAAGRQYTVIVQRGDTLWDLAHQWLGNPHRWPEIYHLNTDRYDEHGRMRGGHHIEPTWKLVLPDDATPPAGTKPGTFIPPATTPTSPPADTVPTTPPTTHTPPATVTPQPSTPSGPLAPGDDGVVGDHPGQTPPPATTPRPADAPAPASTTATAGEPASSTPDAAPTHADPSPPGVSLTGNSWIDLGLALAIAAAARLVWRLRRRRYTPHPAGAHTRHDDPDLTPLPDVVTRIRRNLRTPAPVDHHHTTGDLTHHADDPRTEPDEAVDSDSDTDTDTDTDADPELTDDVGDHAPADPPPLNLPALGNPMLAAWPPAGLGLTGAGAEAAVRGFLASALATGGDDPHGRGSVVLPAATLATLLGAAAVHVPDTPRLTVTGDLAAALELLEEQTLHRTRLVYGHEVDTVAQLRQADPDEEPLPPILLLADTTVAHERTRITALLAQGQRLDIHGVLLGQWPDGNTVVVATDGTTTPGEGERSRHGNHPADIGRLTVITAAEAAALLPTLAESHTGLPQPPAPAEPRPATPPATTAPAAGQHPQPADADPTAGRAEEPTGPAAVGRRTGDAPAADATTRQHVAGPDTAAAPAPVEQARGDGPDLPDSPGMHGADDGPGVVAVKVLGRPAIVGADPDQPLRAKAMELLVYLIAARDGAATVDAMKEDLVPDATVSKAPNRIHTYVYALRQALRRTGGQATYISHPRHRYVLNRDALDVDLWRMRDALAVAETATGAQRVAALRLAVAAYRGPFAEHANYEWAEPYREAIRRQALDAHLALADTLGDQPDEALTVLDKAIDHDPYAEELYRAAMRRHADLNDIDAITDRLAELTRRLEELDTEPSDETSELARALTNDVRRHARRKPGAAA